MFYKRLKRAVTRIRDRLVASVTATADWFSGPFSTFFVNLFGTRVIGYNLPDVIGRPADSFYLDPITEYKNLWCAFHNGQEKEAQRSLFEHIYGNLNALDTKATSILQFNALILAIQSFFIAGPQWSSYEMVDLLHFDAPTLCMPTLILLGMCAAVFSVILCHMTVQLHWSPLPAMYEFGTHFEGLVNIRDRRTRAYRRAWIFSVISLICLLGATWLHVSQIALVYPIWIFEVVVGLILYYLFLHDAVFRAVHVRKVRLARAYILRVLAQRDHSQQSDRS